MTTDQINELFEVSNMISRLWNHMNVKDGQSGDIDARMVQETLTEIDNVILHKVIPDDWEAIVAKSEGRFSR